MRTEAELADQATQGIKRTILQKMDVPGTNMETIVAAVEIAANFKAGRHTHPGDVTGYVAEGEFSITFDGQSEKRLKPASRSWCRMARATRRGRPTSLPS